MVISFRFSVEIVLWKSNCYVAFRFFPKLYIIILNKVLSKILLLLLVPSTFQSLAIVIAIWILDTFNWNCKTKQSLKFLNHVIFLLPTIFHWIRFRISWCISLLLITNPKYWSFQLLELTVILLLFSFFWLPLHLLFHQCRIFSIFFYKSIVQMPQFCSHRPGLRLHII